MLLVQKLFQSKEGYLPIDTWYVDSFATSVFHGKSIVSYLENRSETKERKMGDRTVKAKDEEEKRWIRVNRDVQ